MTTRKSKTQQNLDRIIALVERAVFRKIDRDFSRGSLKSSAPSFYKAECEKGTNKEDEAAVRRIACSPVIRVCVVAILKHLFLLMTDKSPFIVAIPCLHFVEQGINPLKKSAKFARGLGVDVKTAGFTLDIAWEVIVQKALRSDAMCEFSMDGKRYGLALGRDEVYVLRSASSTGHGSRSSKRDVP